ncbi:hypothetical protein [Pontiella sp.]|uniref:hypothetical protein n=1 Tax=Pontiella sp. TaxID=2837462 RepID=UPI003562DA2C
MDLISKLEKRFGSWAIPNLTIYLIGIQLLGVALLMSGRAVLTDFILYGSGVVDLGQWWRLLSFMMIPKTLSPIWLFFAFYIFYLMGNALEERWGAFRFNLFVLCGYLLTVAMAFVNPGAIITNIFFLGCVFLAFATLFPNFELRLFFILPVKVKWLGWLTIASYLILLFSGDPGTRLSIVAALGNYLLFFGKAFFNGFKAEKRRQSFVAETRKVERQALHVCATCGVTDQDDASVHFRYCSTCGKCFCTEHIGNHNH